eukprot:1194922-Prorocentrum_minimum.AAC.8
MEKCLFGQSESLEITCVGIRTNCPCKVTELAFSYSLWRMALSVSARHPRVSQPRVGSINPSRFFKKWQTTWNVYTSNSRTSASFLRLDYNYA